MLPLNKDINTIAVIGPNADSKLSLGNYNGTPSKYVTAIEGIRAKVLLNQGIYAEGCDTKPGKVSGASRPPADFSSMSAPRELM